MGKSEDRVSSEESSAPASRSHAQQQQVTTRRRVRALTMVQEVSSQARVCGDVQLSFHAL